MPKMSMILRVVVTIAAISLALAHVLWPDIKLDAITVAVLVIALIPWLQPIFKSIELTGGLKLELQELKQEVQNIAGAAESAEKKADFAISSSESIHCVRHDQAGEIESLTQLVHKYKEVRLQHPSSSVRTAAMTTIV